MMLKPMSAAEWYEAEKPPVGKEMVIKIWDAAMESQMLAQHPDVARARREQKKDD